MTRNNCHIMLCLYLVWPRPRKRWSWKYW